MARPQITSPPKALTLGLSSEPLKFKLAQGTHVSTGTAAEPATPHGSGSLLAILFQFQEGSP